MSDFVPEGWKKNIFSDAVTLTYGKSPKDIFSEGGIYPVVGTGGITGYTNNYLHEGNTVVIGRKGTINKPSFIYNKFWAIDTTYYVSAYKKLDAKWFFYLLQNTDLTKYNEASGVPSLNRDTLYSIPFITPPLPEQQKIATIITSVDEVIEKTQAQINKLKDLKTGMMQELLTRGVGVDGKPHTEFKDSPVGRIPKGWAVLPLSKVAKLERGKFSHRPRNDPSFYNGDIPFLQTGDIPKKSPYITKYSQTLNEKGLGVSKLFPIGTLVITIAATIGEIGILEFDSCFPDSLVGIKIDVEKADAMYILYVMRHLKDELDLLAPQTAQKNINLDILNPFVVPVPPLKEQKQISQALESIDARLNILDEKLTKIQKTKKALMQDLLTGKVRVKVDTE